MLSGTTPAKPNALTSIEHFAAITLTLQSKGVITLQRCAITIIGAQLSSNYVTSFLGNFCKTVRPILSVCPVCDVGVLWPNGWVDQDEINLAWW